MTATALNLIPAEPVLEQLAELRTMLRRALEADPAAAPAWLPLGKLAAHFGLTRRTLSLHLTRARSTGAVRVLQPALPTGGQGNPLYNVEDVTTYLASITPA